MHTTAKLIGAVAVAVILVIAGMLIVWKTIENKPLLPDRAPSNVEENATIYNTDADKMEVPPDGGGASFNYVKKITVDLSAGTAELYFENPGKALYDAAIFLVVDETVVLKSGLLPPGTKLTSLSLPEEGFLLQHGGYDAELWVQVYDEDGNPLNINFRLQGIKVEVK